MSLAEFDLIQRFFANRSMKNAVTQLGIGDDCALLSVPSGYQLAISTDTMVENVHFLASVEPYDLGYKLLAVNLSDLAAMGAEPVAVTLALTLPSIDEVWLERFAEGFWALAARYNVDLIGGDTTSGPLALTLTVMGLTRNGEALLRSGAKPGDVICVTGNLGDAGLGLKIAQGHYVCDDGRAALMRFHRPEPCIDSARALRTIASSCIDISDGLGQDLGHILTHSGAGACLNWEALPLSGAVARYIAATGDWHLPLCAGDDYELCFTVAPENLDRLQGDYVRIGVIETKPGLRLRRSGRVESLQIRGFEHFSAR